MTRQQIIDLLAMSRFANLPTVWSNGLLGALIGWGTFKASPNPLTYILIFLSLSALYLGGCFFNDWHDQAFDKKTRPDRPLPSGRWKSKTIFTLSASLMLGGLILSALASIPSALFASGIIICILAYTRWHKVHPASFVFMAGARALIYPTTFCSQLSWHELTNQGLPIFIILALGLGGYILGISLTARAETSSTPKSDAQKIFPILCLCAPILFISAIPLAGGVAAAIPPMIIFIAVIAYSVRDLRAKHDVGLFVSRALATIPLVDYLMVFIIAPHFAFLIIPPILALAALGLQKIAPAT